MPDSPAGDAGLPGTTCPLTLNEPKNNHQRTHTDPSARGAHACVCATVDFDLFWERYPRKVGRAAAERAYATARQTATDAEILRGLDRCQWPENARFIPNPARWLAEDRWRDDPGAAAPLPPLRESAGARLRRECGLDEANDHLFRPADSSAAQPPARLQ
jgi:hypothetical protein